MCTLNEIKVAMSLLDNTPFGIVVTDKDARIIDINKVFTEITGYYKEELIGKKIGKESGIMYSGYHNDKFYQDMWVKLKKCNTFKGMIKNRKKDGNFYWQSVTITCYPRVEGTEVEHYIAYIFDNTAAIQTENFLNQIINTVPGLIYVIDLNTKENMFQSKDTKNILGYENEEITHSGNTYKEFVHPDDISLLYEVDESIKNDEDTVITTEYRVKHKDGSYVWLRASESLFEKDDSGTLSKIGVAINITHEKIYAEKISKLKETIEHLLETSKEVNQSLLNTLNR